MAYEKALLVEREKALIFPGALINKQEAGGRRSRF
jgi:hypothetical protein